MPVFEVVVTETPTKRQKEDGAVGRIILGPRAYTAKSGTMAILFAGRELPENAPLGRLEVQVRPFDE